MTSVAFLTLASSLNIFVILRLKTKTSKTNVKWNKSRYGRISGQHIPSYPIPSWNVQIWSFFCSVFSSIRTEYGDHGVNFRIQLEYRKIRTRKTLYLYIFHPVSGLNSRSMLPFNPYLENVFKVNNRNTRKRCGICLHFTIKTTEHVIFSG